MQNSLKVAHSKNELIRLNSPVTTPPGRPSSPGRNANRSTVKIEPCVQKRTMTLTASQHAHRAQHIAPRQGGEHGRPIGSVTVEMPEDATYDDCNLRDAWLCVIVAWQRPCSEGYLCRHGRADCGTDAGRPEEDALLLSRAQRHRALQWPLI